MATHPQALKRHRQSIKRRRRNRYFLASMRNCVRRVREHADQGNAAEARKELAEALRTIDRSAQKGVIHKTKAARVKSRLVHLVSKLS